MKSMLFAAAAATTMLPVAVEAQEAAPLAVAPKSAAANAVLPVNTEVLLRMSKEVTTKGRKWDEGATFRLTVARDVKLGNYVVIPAGSPAKGRITWLTSRGAFGKSGKMDVELESVEVNGRVIPLNGTYRQEGEGATMATLGGVLVAGVFAGFITGRSGRIPEGRELMATTEQPIELAVAASAVGQSSHRAAFAPASNQVAIVEAASSEGSMDASATSTAGLK